MPDFGMVFGMKNSIKKQASILAYKLTARPELFKDTYWGRFESARNPEGTTPAIIANRDTFAVEFDLTRLLLGWFSHRVDPDGQFTFDHPEQYRATNGDKIFVVSLYAIAPIQPDEIARLDRCGFKPYAPIYREDCQTFVLRVPKGTKRNWIRTA